MIGSLYFTQITMPSVGWCRLKTQVVDSHAGRYCCNNTTSPSNISQVSRIQMPMLFLVVPMTLSFMLAHTIYLVYQLAVFVTSNAKMLNSLISSPFWKLMNVHGIITEPARLYFIETDFIWMTMVCYFSFGYPPNVHNVMYAHNS